MMAANREHTRVDRAPVGWAFWLWWVLANTVAEAVGGAAGLAVAGALLGTITGIALVWLLRQPVTPGREAAEDRLART